MPCASDSPAICRTTSPCVQPSAFSVPSSRMRLPTDESASSAASRNAATAATIESTSPRLFERFFASTSEPLIWSATSFELATCACGSAVSIAFCTLPTDELFAARTRTTLASPCLARELLQLLERQVDVGALAAERRADEPDDRERRPVQVELRADLQAVLRRVGAGDERFAAAGGGEEAALRDLRLGDDAHRRVRLVDAADRVRGRLDVRLRRIEHLLERLLGRREVACGTAQARRQALRERAAVDPAAAAAAATAAEAAAPPFAPPFGRCSSHRSSRRSGARSLSKHACIAANCAAVGRGRLRRIWNVWPPGLQLRDDLRDDALLVLGEQREALASPARRRRSTRSASRRSAGTSAACRAGRSRGRSGCRACRASTGR